MEYRVLGSVAVVEGEADLALGGPRQRRLLAVLLAAEGRPVSVDRLVVAVWGDDAPEGAHRTVLSYVSRLRSVLGADAVVLRDGSYRLDRDGCPLDAERFRSLVGEARNAPPARALALLDEALRLWHGQAFGDLADEVWCRPEASSLEELRLVALELRAQARLDLGAHAEAVPELQRLVAEHPLRERFRGQLMLALYRSGRQAEALRAFQEHRVFLAEETGLEPSAAHWSCWTWPRARGWATNFGSALRQRRRSR